MKRKMSLQEATELVPDDLPDGAYWAMVHEIAGAEYGDCWEELESHPCHKPFKQTAKKTIECPQCKRKFSSFEILKQHEAQMFRNGTHQRILTAQPEHLETTK